MTTASRAFRRFPFVAHGLCAFLVGLAGSVRAEARLFSVGPQAEYKSIADVPWISVGAGDTVEILWRPEPYHERIFVGNSGREDAPIIITGVLGPDGQRPVLDARDSRASPDLDFWNEDRGVIRVSGSSRPTDQYVRFLTIENLEIRGARLGTSFISQTGRPWRFLDNASGIHVEKGANIVIRNCLIHNNGIGVFISGPRVGEPSRDILLENNYIHTNGYAESGQHHNVYIQAVNVVYQYNRMVLPENFGANIKDRSAGLTVRFNLIEGGNRALDLVNSALVAEYASRAHDLVYGNVIVKLGGYDNDEVVNYGYDTEPSLASTHRSDLRFFNNTFFNRRTSHVVLFGIRNPLAQVVIESNVFFIPDTVYYGTDLVQGPGTGRIINNWFSRGACQAPDERVLLGCTRTIPLDGSGKFIDGGDNRWADDPLIDRSSLRPLRTSSLVGSGTVPIADLSREYVPHQASTTRDYDERPSIGAYEPADDEPEDGAREQF